MGDRWQDISISDASLKAEFISKFLNGDYTNAFAIIENNPQLDTKAFLANVLNEIANFLSLLQNGFQYEVIDYLSTQLTNFDNLINEFKSKSEWENDVVYQIYNFVSYNGIDYMYINTTPSSNILPTNQNYWIEINNRGEQGGYGIGVDLKYDWDSSVRYNPLDVVYYNNTLWVAVSSNINKIPSDESEWQTLVGNVISITNDQDYTVDECIVSFDPIQSGTGDPSPTNIRPITGWTELNIWQEATYDTSASPEVSVSWQTEAGTVYCGELNLNTGVLKATHASIDLGSLTWVYFSSLNYNLISDYDLHAQSTIGKPNAICSCYTVYSYADGISAETGITIVNQIDAQTSNIKTCIWVHDLNYNNANAFKQDVTGQLFVYQLKSPVTYQLTPYQIELLSGSNVIWTDGGDMSIKLSKQYWEQFLQFTPAEIYSDIFPPTGDNLYNGAIWIEIIADYTTETGRIINFVAQHSHAINIEIEIEPIQYLNGYSNPWPGGGGKNKYPIDIGYDTCSNNDGATHSTGENGELIIVTSSSYTNSGVAFSTNSTLSSVLDSFGEDERVISMDIVASATGDVRITSDATGTLYTVGTTKTRISCLSTRNTLSIYGVNNGATLTVSNLMVESGTTATSFEPYSNICLITGHTSANINVTPKNIFNESLANFKNYYILNAYGTETQNNAYRYTQNYIAVSPSTIYACQAEKTNLSSNSFTVCEYDENKIFIRRVQIYSSSLSGVHSGSFMTTATTKYIRFSLGMATRNIMIESGSQASTYEAFGETTQISFGQTVYGGELIVGNDGNRSLVIDRVMEEFNGTEDWDIAGEGTDNRRFYVELSEDPINDYLLISEKSLVSSGTITTDSIGEFGVFRVYPVGFFAAFDKNSHFADITEFKLWVTTQYNNNTPLQVVYPLATPITVSLTAGQINDLQGNNIVWVDDSNNIIVDYLSN